MKRNKIKIVSNKNMKSLSFYFQNENLKWIRVSNSSLLSRKEYTYTTIKDKAYDILQIINETYSPGNRGVDLYFEGSDDDYNTLCEIVKNNHFDGNIMCHQNKMKIAIAGKIGSGKTTLIEELGSLLNIRYEITEHTGFTVYADKEGNAEWCELKGIDLGKENVIKTKNVLGVLASSGLTTFIYCLGTSKIEELEEKFILYVRDNYPEVKIMIVLTSCIYDEAFLFAEQLSKSINRTKVIPVLARQLKTREGIIPTFGLEEVLKYILEEK